MTRSRSQIVVVDDQPESQQALKVALPTADVIVRAPAQVVERDLRGADLVLVDLSLSKWPDRSSTRVLAQWPEDGLALISLLRAHVHRIKKSTPTTFALYSSHLDQFWGSLPPEYRAHVLAREKDLDWIFTKPKRDSSSQLPNQLLSLAAATRSLPRRWPEGSFQAVQSTVSRLLGLRKQTPWFAEAWGDIESCHPPVHDLIEATSGIVFLRWLLQRILPYPCFLWDQRSLALRLGVKSEGLSEFLAGRSEPAMKLGECEYRGMLSSFLGRRWWRTGVESFLWQATGGTSSESSAILKALGGARSRLTPHPYTGQVLCIDEHFQPIPQPQVPDECVRIQPDDWPPYSDPAWTTLALARKYSKLTSLVIAADRPRLGSN